MSLPFFSIWYLVLKNTCCGAWKNIHSSLLLHWVEWTASLTRLIYLKPLDSAKWLTRLSDAIESIQNYKYCRLRKTKKRKFAESTPEIALSCWTLYSKMMYSFIIWTQPNLRRLISGACRQTISSSFRKYFPTVLNLKRVSFLYILC